MGRVKGVKTPVQRGIRVLAPFTAARLAEHRPLVPRRLCRLSRGERQLLERPVNPALLAREGLHDLRIELASRRAQDLVDRALPAERRAIANNPAGLAAIEAIGVLGWPRDEIAILSLGCGAEALDVRTRGWWRSGLFGFAPKVVAVFLTAQSDASCGSAIHLLSDRRNFHRISPTLPAKRYGLDVTRELPSLSSLGNTEARHRLHEIRPLFFSAPAEPFVPELAL